MRLINSYIFVTFLILNVNSIQFYKRVRDSHSYSVYPCADNTDIITQFSAGLISGYNVIINKGVETGTNIKFGFDSEATVTFDKDFGIFYNAPDNINNIFDIILLRSSDNFLINVRGQPTPYSPPYLTSFKINGYELCHHPNLTYFEEYPVGIVKRPDVPDCFCGRRKILRKDMLLNAVKSKPGDWPWHAALYRREISGLSYKCGGTLISKFLVLTAAHCITIRGVAMLPEIFSVYLGKYNLHGGDVAEQEREVFKVYVHDEFAYRTLDHDISLLKLKMEAVFDNHVQPICLWSNDVYNRLPSSKIQGTVAGWGFDTTDALTPTLHAASMPIVSDLTCALTNPLFYVTALKTAKKFCAGYTNGISACNGDGGGSFSVFVPDLAKSNSSEVPGAWYVRGIVSNILSRSDVAICNPNAYVVFTDVEKYLDWIKKKKNYKMQCVFLLLISF